MAKYHDFEEVGTDLSGFRRSHKFTGVPIGADSTTKPSNIYYNNNKTGHNTNKLDDIYYNIDDTVHNNNQLQLSQNNVRVSSKSLSEKPKPPQLSQNNVRVRVGVGCEPTVPKSTKIVVPKTSVGVGRQGSGMSAKLVSEGLALLEAKTLAPAQTKSQEIRERSEKSKEVKRMVRMVIDETSKELENLRRILQSYSELSEAGKEYIKKRLREVKT